MDPRDPGLAAGGIRKIKFTHDEDVLLTDLVARYGDGDWAAVAEQMPGRNVRQCRERWFNYLSPSVTNGPWSSEDDARLLEKTREFGSRWKSLTQFFPGRTDINIKNHYITLTRRRCAPLRHTSPDEPSPESVELLPAPLAKTETVPAPLPLFEAFDQDRPTIEWCSFIETSGDVNVTNAQQRNLDMDFFFMYQGL
jgi:hypothetical protein